MGFLFAFWGCSRVAALISLAFTGVSEFGSHWMLKAIVLFCIWPETLVALLQEILRIPSPSAFDVADVTPPIVGGPCPEHFYSRGGFGPGDPCFQKKTGGISNSDNWLKCRSFRVIGFPLGHERHEPLAPL
jgi:hypothetical protein